MRKYMTNSVELARLIAGFEDCSELNFVARSVDVTSDEPEEIPEGVNAVLLHCHHGVNGSSSATVHLVRGLGGSQGVQEISFRIKDTVLITTLDGKEVLGKDCPSSVKDWDSLRSYIRSLGHEKSENGTTIGSFTK